MTNWKNVDDFIELDDEVFDVFRGDDSDSPEDVEPDAWDYTLPVLTTTDIPLPGDDVFTAWDKDPLPEWISGFREHQWLAAVEAVDAFRAGADIVWVDAPTGTGKTLVGEIVRRLMGVPGWYTCSTKSLQDQFSRDFPYSRILKGRSNYATTSMPFPDYTTADCTKAGGGEMDMCYWCPEIHECSYEMAKAEAMRSKLGILNMSYLLTEGNYVGKTVGRGLNIVDECDTLEGELMGFVDYQVSEYRLRKLGLSAPKKGSRKKTILDFMQDELKPGIVKHVRSIPQGMDVAQIRERQGFMKLLGDTERIIEDLTAELEAGLEEEDSTSNWVRDNDAGPLVMKPVRVGHYGEMLWGLSEKWLCMSATIVSSDEMNESLGVNELGLKTATVTVPMMFPVENRPIMVVPVASMTYQNQEKSWPLMAQAIRRIMDRHADERILVHTVSYKFSDYLMRTINSRRCITYTVSHEKEEALARYRRTAGSVLLASSMDRGVDLKDDDCRVVVVAKIPFPSLGDRQVSMRMRGKGGQEWYNVQTVRKLVQMTGRGVRSSEDHCTTYILDEMFMNKIWRGAKHLLPGWWRDAVQVRRVREFQ